MAGLWERVRPDAVGRINIHLIVAGLKAYHVNTIDATKGASRAQVRDALNAVLAQQQPPPPLLSPAEEADLNGIANTLDAQASNTTKLIFLSAVEYAMIAAEAGVVNEAKWRGDLGI